ncbi:hypothetical protein EV182_005292, partial [Spiromyces aspiralis]
MGPATDGVGLVLTWMDISESCPTCRASQGSNPPIALYLNLDDVGHRQLPGQQAHGSRDPVEVSDSESSVTGAESRGVPKRPRSRPSHERNLNLKIITALKQQLESTESQVAAKEAERAALEERNSHLKRSRDELAAKLERLRKKYENKKRELERCQHVSNALASEKGSLFDENSELKAKLEHFDRIKARLELMSTANSRLKAKLRQEINRYNQLNDLYMMLSRAHANQRQTLQPGPGDFNSLSSNHGGTGHARTHRSSPSSSLSKMEEDQDTDLDEYDTGQNNVVGRPNSW